VPRVRRHDGVDIVVIVIVVVLLVWVLELNLLHVVELGIRRLGV